MSWLLALIFKPLIFLVVLGLICLPARLAVQRWLPEGKLKRLLLIEVTPKQPKRRP
jgi:hypothetical protein